VSPLFAHEPAVWILVFVSISIWRVVESASEGRLSHRLSRKREPAPREWSFYWIVLLLLASVIGSIATGLARVATIPGPPWWPVIAGTILIWLGLAFRAWSIITLGRFFKVMVVIQDDHQVIDHGPYRLLRHPSYLGMIVAMTGLGLAEGSWASVAIAACGTAAAFVVRIYVEEHAMLQELGEDYAAYMQRTSRLLPGIY
jgi:protein-S-isoprenylcysteine O-methyltransferase Ste14